MATDSMCSRVAKQMISNGVRSMGAWARISSATQERCVSLLSVDVMPVSLDSVDPNRKPLLQGVFIHHRHRLVGQVEPRPLKESGAVDRRGHLRE